MFKIMGIFDENMFYLSLALCFLKMADKFAFPQKANPFIRQSRGLDQSGRVNEGSTLNGISVANYLINFICRLRFQLVIGLHRQRS